MLLVVMAFLSCLILQARFISFVFVFLFLLTHDFCVMSFDYFFACYIFTAAYPVHIKVCYSPPPRITWRRVILVFT